MRRRGSSLRSFKNRERAGTGCSEMGGMLRRGEPLLPPERRPADGEAEVFRAMVVSSNLGPSLARICGIETGGRPRDSGDLPLAKDGRGCPAVETDLGGSRKGGPRRGGMQ